MRCLVPRANISKTGNSAVFRFTLSGSRDLRSDPPPDYTSQLHPVILLAPAGFVIFNFTAGRCTKIFCMWQRQGSHLKQRINFPMTTLKKIASFFPYQDRRGTL
jgi:hypothetical protein